MIGSPAIPFLLFEKLRDINANTLMITKGSSEHSICIGIREEDTDRVQEALADQFYRVGIFFYPCEVLNFFFVFFFFKVFSFVLS